MIRKATKADVYRVWQIRTQAILISCSSHYSQETVSSWSSAPMPDGFADVLVHHEALVFEVQNQLLAFGFVDIQQRRLEALFVTPDYAGKGYGKLIASELLLVAQRAGVKQLTLSSSLNAVKFYQGLGFVAKEETLWVHPLGFEMASVVMVKQLF
ncbi:GNAT family N-acetyltransferase [Shewanella sp. 10N.286.45.A1]|uniref:GNAT family N-acetyltransferase n=1 Tax=Shewanella sp. 10N.286.45.A1 TaxID=3229694 RepID=UPI0035547265